MTIQKNIKSLQINDYVYTLSSNSDYFSKVITSPIQLSSPNLILADGRTISENDSTLGSFVTEMASQVGTNPLVQTTAEYEADFVRPNLTSNGTLGGNSFAVSASSYYSDYYAIWHAMNGTRIDDSVSGGDAWLTANTSSGYYIFYNPEPIKVTNLRIYNRPYNGEYESAVRHGTVYGSNDNIEYEELTNFTNNVFGSNQGWDISLTSNNKFFKYYKIYVDNEGNYQYVNIGEIEITAKYKTIGNISDAISQGKYVYNETSHELTIPSYDNTTFYHYVII